MMVGSPFGKGTCGVEKMGLKFIENQNEIGLFLNN